MFRRNSRCFDYGFGGMQEPMFAGNECAPIMEPPCEKIVNREINHQVRHIQPVHTRVINHHTYHHTYEPCYTCSEENVVCNVYGSNPCCK